MIANVELNSDSDDLDSQLFEDVVGQAHFVRAWCYFSLTRLFGDVPLLLDLPNNENLMNELTPSKIIYASIIKDAEKAINMINGVSGSHYRCQYA